MRNKNLIPSQTFGLLVKNLLLLRRKKNLFKSLFLLPLLNAFILMFIWNPNIILNNKVALLISKKVTFESTLINPIWPSPLLALPFILAYSKSESENSQFVHDAMNFVKSKIVAELPDDTWVYLQEFESENDIVSRALAEERIWAAVIWNISTGADESKNYNYTIRMLENRGPPTSHSKTILDGKICGEDRTQCFADRYISSGLLALQQIIDEAILYGSGSSNVDWTPSLVQLLPLRDALFLHGVLKSSWHLSWILSTFLFTCIPSLAVSYLYTSSSAFLSNATFSIVFWLLTITNFANTAFSGLLSVIFKKSRASSIFVSIFSLLGPISVAILHGFDPEGVLVSKITLLALSVVFYPFGFGCILANELKFNQKLGSGLRVGNLFAEDGSGWFIVAITISILFYVLLTIYLEEMGSLWISYIYQLIKTLRKNFIIESNQEDFLEVDSSDVPSEFNYIQSDPSDLRPLITVKNLRKEFSGVPAIKNISFNLYQGEIFALIGSNGAGKTTTLNILTGLLPATSGTAKICGFDVKTQMKEIKQQTGVVLQQNIFYDELDFFEH
ncbi:hypothetical protein HK096_007683, partial [Nowakowskiella sp. JEL0078]